MRVQDEKICTTGKQFIPEALLVKTIGSTLKTVEPRILLEKKEMKNKRMKNNELLTMNDVYRRV